MSGPRVDQLSKTSGLVASSPAGAIAAWTYDRLATRLDMSVDQIESVIRLVRSRLDASVVRYLRDDAQR